MEKVKPESVIEKLQEKSNAKTLFTNSVIIDMLENSNIETLEIDTTRQGSFNRGSIVEIIVKNAILNYLGFNACDLEKSVNGCDLNLTKRNKTLLNDLGLKNEKYEVKLITALARASKIYDLASVNNLIIIDLRQKSMGAYLVNVKDLVYYTSSSGVYDGSIKDYNNAKKLELLNEILGL